MIKGMERKMLTKPPKILPKMMLKTRVKSSQTLNQVLVLRKYSADC